MHVILGAAGQVGSLVVGELAAKQLPVRAVARKPLPALDKKIDVRQADLFDVDALVHAFEGASTVFLLTPEKPDAKDIIGETKQLVANYRKAIELTGVRRLVGLSSMGAQLDGDTGNLLQSRMLEQGFHDLEVEQVFIRPSYYYSNWLGFLDTVRKDGVLPTFFPPDLRVEMNAPADVAKFVAAVIAGEQPRQERIYEVAGPGAYSTADVAAVCAQVYNNPVEVVTIPAEERETSLQSAGFSADAASNMSKMTQAVIDGLTVPEFPNRLVRLPMGLLQYFQELVPDAK